MFPFKMTKDAILWLFRSYALKKKEGARFDEPKHYNSYLNSANRGLLLNGVDLSLSEKDSFQNLCLISRIGAGKTSRYVIPNILYRAKEKCSMVINDPKGEVYDATSSYLKSRGYSVIAVSPENPEYSEGFNPLTEARNDIELEQIAEIIIKAGNPNKEDEFWSHGATRFISLFLKTLRIAEYDEPGVNTLMNLYYLFQNFGQDGQPLDKWMAKNTVIPGDSDNPVLWNEWTGLLTGNEKGIQSFVLNAIIALRALSNKSVAQVTAGTDFSLNKIRNEKTAIFFITPPQLAEYYGFLTSIFFRSVFNASMRKIPDRKTLPLYVFYDEFGHSTIPNFVSTANTIRAYKVSISVVLQSISQLSTRYGKESAETIKGGFATYLTYSGSDPETTQFFELIMGRSRITQYSGGSKGFDEKYREENLMNSAEVRMLEDDEVLIVSSNRQPAKIRTKAYFEQAKLNRITKKPPLPIKKKILTPLRYTQL